VRDRYNAPREVEHFRRFLAGELDDFSWSEGWLNMIREATAEGRLFSRVRVVSVPLTDYSRFGLRGALFTGEAGEDIRYVARDAAQRDGLPDHDYWLFDSRKLVTMHFGEDDRFVSAEIVEDPATIVQHNYWRDVARHRAISRDEFSSKYEQRDYER
jgi:hypothetical protein